METLPDLPEEILFNIFSRLPAKSIGKCRCLSKQWLNLLSTKQFIKSHLARVKQENLILTTPSHTIRSVDTIKGYDRGTVSRELAVAGRWIASFGSCDGLLLLLNNARDLFLVNPITLEQVKIPNSPVAFNLYGGDTIYGFGYDSVRDDYKVVKVCYHAKQSRVGIFDTFVAMYAYYTKKGFWERLESPPYDYTCPLIPSGAYVNGAYHWVGAWSRDLDCNVIAAFDFANEVFSEILPPSGVDIEDLLHFTIGVLGGCLCVIDAINDTEGLDVWIMKEYGVTDSWSKFSLAVGEYHFGDLFKPLCFIGDREEGEVVLVIEGTRLVAYNLKEGTSMDVVVDRVPGKFVDGCTFMESLVSPVTLCGHREEQASV
ncbi:hypothetical protein CASFOL_005110 [Castilleja foliolosa]|uniref:F-box domain-containing protein n=1 Tax=Castilleja foliolosa TaxID=1961234 RepID=A0ABD3E3T6_9LAMI